MEEYRLTLSGQPVHLTPKAMDLLILLARNRPRLMTRTELIDLLWPDVVVVPTNLRNLVSELRCALDDRGGEIVRTVHGRGYAFTDCAREVRSAGAMGGSPIAFLRDVERRSSFAIWPGENTIGRGGECDITIPDSRVSRKHARIILSAGEVGVVDLNSRNGTFVRGQRIDALTSLDDGEEISFGPLRFTISTSFGESDTLSANSAPESPPPSEEGET